jgi:hypothetical protein
MPNRISRENRWHSHVVQCVLCSSIFPPLMPALPGHTPHRTPLRRISHGSLFTLSRSGNNPDAPHGLGFIEPVMTELVDEVETLQSNVEGLRNLSESLKTFNESFASWLYVMDMNALTVDWPQVNSFRYDQVHHPISVCSIRLQQTRHSSWQSAEQVRFVPKNTFEME